VDGYYEHHTSLRKDKLCPFKIGINSTAHSVPCNWHRNLEILWILKGSGKVQYGKHSHTVREGDIVIVNSGVLHRPYSEEWMQYCVIIVDEQFCEENGLDTTYRTYTECFQDAQTERLLKNAAAHMKEYTAGADFLSIARVRLAMLELMIEITAHHSCIREAETEKNTPSEEHVKRVLEYLNDNYTDHITLDELADLCGVTKQHLAREFKRVTGQTICTYTNMLRCKKAEVALADGMSVTEAALESGFESLSYFSRTYKKLMGTVPSKNR